MKTLIIIALLATTVIADTKQECFLQYKTGKINKKELMQCSNIQSIEAPTLNYTPVAVDSTETKTVTLARDDRGIKNRCATKWGVNYKMQKYCIKGQKEALAEIQIYANKDILNYCSSKWETDYKMNKYCYNKQSDALAEIKKAIDIKVLNYCSNKWENNYSMVKYCYNKQYKAKKSLGY